MHAKEHEILHSMQEKEQQLHSASSLLISNLPKYFNNVMLQELLRNFPDVGNLEEKGSGSVLVKFASAESARTAMSGKIAPSTDYTQCRPQQL